MTKETMVAQCVRKLNRRNYYIAEYHNAIRNAILDLANADDAHTIEDLDDDIFDAKDSLATVHAYADSLLKSIRRLKQ